MLWNVPLHCHTHVHIYKRRHKRWWTKAKGGHFGGPKQSSGNWPLFKANNSFHFNDSIWPLVTQIKTTSFLWFIIYFIFDFRLFCIHSATSNLREEEYEVPVNGPSLHANVISISYAHALNEAYSISLKPVRDPEAKKILGMRQKLMLRVKYWSEIFLSLLTIIRFLRKGKKVMKGLVAGVKFHPLTLSWLFMDDATVCMLMHLNLREIVCRVLPPFPIILCTYQCQAPGWGGGGCGLPTGNWFSELFPG